ncbi:MAG: serine hydrolase [Longimicrobiales bacterium]
MRRLPATLLALPIALALAFAGSAAALAAQQAATPLVPDRVLADSLGPEEVDAYTLELEAERFVYGEVEQISVDVVVTISGPDGSTIRTVDGPARGLESFQFDAEAAGRYRIEVKPFEDGAGRYAIAIRRVEPIASAPEARVDQLMTRYARDDVPGGVIGVVRGGELVFAKAYGAADLTHAIPFTTTTRTNIGSVSKQFTAFAITLLAEQGALSLDDDVRQHVPELPDFGSIVTLRNLLTHTSGYREFLNTLALTGRRLDEGDYIGREEIIEIVRRQPELQNEPGAEWNYNNTAFALLALVVERVTDQEFPDWMREHVFGPLGMDSTLVRAEPSQIVRNSARGYRPGEEGGWREAGDLGGAMGAGAIYTTVGDLARWVRNFRSGTLGGAAVFRQLSTPYVLTDGDTTEYGFGLAVDRYRGRQRVHHGGADVAHRAILRYFPELDAAVIALSNNATFNSGALANDVADAFLEAEFEPELADDGDDAAFDPESYDPEDFDELAGRYALEEMPSFVMTFSREADTLFAQATGQPRVRLLPTSDSTFRLTVVDASLTFHREPDGGADSLTLHQNGDRVAHRIDADAWEPAAAELEAYTGRYYSAELETYYTIALEEERLVLRHRRFDEALKLTPGAERDAFTATFPIAELTFLRDASGAVTGLEVANTRTRGVRFERVAGDGGG